MLFKAVDIWPLLSGAFNREALCRNLPLPLVSGDATVLLAPLECLWGVMGAHPFWRPLSWCRGNAILSCLGTCLLITFACWSHPCLPSLFKFENSCFTYWVESHFFELFPEPPGLETGWLLDSLLSLFLELYTLPYSSGDRGDCCPLDPYSVNQMMYFSSGMYCCPWSSPAVSWGQR